MSLFNISSLNSDPPPIYYWVIKIHIFMEVTLLGFLNHALMSHLLLNPSNSKDPLL
jgi:hypothetical protein